MADRLLLSVEGPDDQHVIWAILSLHGFEPEFAVKEEGGYETLYKRLSPRLKPGTDLERFGIVVDADEDIANRWRSIKGALRSAGYTDLPEQPDPTGTIVDHEDLPRLGVWIMPNNVLAGMLEDYMALLVPISDPLAGSREAMPWGDPGEGDSFQGSPSGQGVDSHLARLARSPGNSAGPGDHQALLPTLQSQRRRFPVLVNSALCLTCPLHAISHGPQPEFHVTSSCSSPSTCSPSSPTRPAARR